MARLRKQHLPHRVDIQPHEGDGAEGDLWGTTRSDRPAYVEQKVNLVVDRRSTSPTSGQEITSSTFVVVMLADYTAPRSRVTVAVGMPRTSEVVAAEYFDYPRTPSHAVLYLE